MQPPVVLVHGLWHPPGHVDAVAGLLRDTGAAVTVPGHSPFLSRPELGADLVTALLPHRGEAPPPGR